jgi:endonuclease YncB( thermonuclease family)
MNKFDLFIISILVVLAPVVVFSSPAISATKGYIGKVVDVTDGDTITVRTENQGEKTIRLSGIDCPETFQLHGNEAKRFTASKLQDRRVRVLPLTVDEYGRIVAVVFVNGENINEQLVAHGHGWVYRKYCQAAYCRDWLKLETTARDARVGLWADQNPRPPWEWREAERTKERDNGRLAPAPGKVTVPALSDAAKAGGSSTVFHGNRRSFVFHSPNCPDYNCKNCTVILPSSGEAMRAGYKRHRECVKDF